MATDAWSQRAQMPQPAPMAPLVMVAIRTCPECKSRTLRYKGKPRDECQLGWWECRKCGHRWKDLPSGEQPMAGAYLG